MTYHYLGGGTVLTGSFAPAHKNLYVRYKFDKYSVAYDREAAQKGVLKKVFIQKVILKNIVKSWHKDVVMYVDSMKSMYNERDLLTLAEAQAVVDQSVYVPPNCDPPTDPPPPLPSAYLPNSVHYSKPAAIVGRLEKVVILRSLPYQPKVYVSTLQGIFSEDDLVTLSQAQQLIDEAPEHPPYCPEAPEPPPPLPSLYAPNSVFYSRGDAEKGKMVKIVILRSLPQSPTVYQDTLHGLWNESELVSEAAAKSLALEYWVSRKASLEQLYDKLI